MDDLTSLLPGAEPPVVAQQPMAPSGPSETDILRQQLHFQNQLLAQVIPRPQAESPRAEAPPQWTDQEYISPDDARLILDSPAEQLPQRLNRAVNAAVRSVHETVQQQMRRLEEENRSLRGDIDSRWAGLEQQQAAQFWQNSFYEANPDLREDPELVQRATMLVAQQVTQDPSRPRSVQHTLAEIAATAKSLKQQMLARWGVQVPESQTSPTVDRSPGRRAQVETGGSSRVSAPAPGQPNAQKSALHDMIAYVRGGK